MRKKLFSSNLETNKLFERRPEEEESTELLLDDSKYRHKVQRPEGFETLCQRDPSCSEGCDVCCKLPYHNKSGEKKNKTSQPISVMVFRNTRCPSWYCRKLVILEYPCYEVGNSRIIQTSILNSSQDQINSNMNLFLLSQISRFSISQRW